LRFNFERILKNFLKPEISEKQQEKLSDVIGDKRVKVKCKRKRKRKRKSKSKGKSKSKKQKAKVKVKVKVRVKVNRIKEHEINREPISGHKHR